MESIVIRSEFDSTVKQEIVRGYNVTKIDRLKRISIEMEDGVRYDIEHDLLEGGLRISKIEGLSGRLSIMPCVSNVVVIK